MRRETHRLRDACMQEIYARVTVNLNHLASRLVMRLLDRGDQRDRPRPLPQAALSRHSRSRSRSRRSICSAASPAPIPMPASTTARSRQFLDFIETAIASGLVEVDGDAIPVPAEAAAGAFLPRDAPRERRHRLRQRSRTRCRRLPSRRPGDRNRAGRHRRIAGPPSVRRRAARLCRRQAGLFAAAPCRDQRQGNRDRKRRALPDRAGTGERHRHRPGPRIPCLSGGDEGVRRYALPASAIRSSASA